MENVDRRDGNGKVENVLDSENQPHKKKKKKGKKTDEKLSDKQTNSAL